MGEPTPQCLKTQPSSLAIVLSTCLWREEAHGNGHGEQHWEDQEHRDEIAPARPRERGPVKFVCPCPCVCACARACVAVGIMGEGRASHHSATCVNTRACLRLQPLLASPHQSSSRDLQLQRAGVEACGLRIPGVPLDVAAASPQAVASSREGLSVEGSAAFRFGKNTFGKNNMLLSKFLIDLEAACKAAK